MGFVIDIRTILNVEYDNFKLVLKLQYFFLMYVSAILICTK